jgi:hypothetical protein
MTMLTSARSATIRGRDVLLIVVCFCLTAGGLPASANAQPTGAAWHVSVVAQPTNLAVSAGGFGEPFDRYAVVLTNTGDTMSGPVTVTDTLPNGVTARTGGLQQGLRGWECGAESGASVVKCVYPAGIAALAQSTLLVIPVRVAVASGTPLPFSLTNTVTATGGRAPVAVGSATSQVGAAPPPFSVIGFTSQWSEPNGMPATQAASHPFALTTTFGFPQQATIAQPEVPEKDVAHPRALEIDLPMGLIGDPQAAPRCPIVNVFNQDCQPNSRVGTLFLNLAQGLFNEDSAFSIYNVVPDQGYPAEFGVFAKGLNRPVFMYASVDPGPGYGLHLSVPDIPEAAEASNVIATFFGDPQLANGGGNASTAFFSNPSDCSGVPLVTKIKADTWEEPSHWVEAETEAPAVAGCDRLQFTPSIRFTPPSSEAGRADEPSGFTFDLQIPQTQSAGVEGLATPDLRNVRVMLPLGVSIDPSAADGLGACQATGPEGFNMEGPESAAPNSVGALAPVSGHCPLDSQVGTVEAETPLLPPHALTGHLYIAQPQCGGEGEAACTDADAQDGRLFSVDLQVEGEGVVVKLHGTVFANPSDGQLTATFDNNPQLPVSDIKLHLNGGPRAPLANPQTCGEALTTSDITPWSAPETPDGHPASMFEVTGCEGFPFAPGFMAGTTTTNAGAFTDFAATFNRPDRQQNLDAIQVTTPPGLLGMLSHVVLCGEPQAAKGACSPASQIGVATVAAGAGSHPYWVTGPVYLTGPYRGAPFGLSVAIPAKAGPFNLGTVVVRSAITINPATSSLTITSDPLPQILDGVPLRVQTVNVTVNHPQFMFNPTNCDGKQITGTFVSAQGATAQVSSPFAAGGCKNLPFDPSFRAFTQSKYSKSNGASLTVKIASTPGESNTHRVDIAIPAQLPSRLSTLNKACTAAVFEANPASCPAGSVIGVAKVSTPVLNVPLTGPAILVSHGGAGFPDVEFVLQGEGVTVILDGKTQIKKGVTFSHFETVPDAPFLSFETILPEGPHSIFAAYLPKKRQTLCSTPLRIPTTITGQNGAVLKQTTKVHVTGCTAHTAKKATTHHARQSRGGR